MQRTSKKEFVAILGESYPFTVDFMYVLGTDYDNTHTNFGFSSEYPANSDPLAVQQNGVAINNEAWNPPIPDVSISPAAMQTAIYSAVLGFSSNGTIFDRLLTLGSVGIARTNPLFSGVLEYNQGI